MGQTKHMRAPCEPDSVLPSGTEPLQSFAMSRRTFLGGLGAMALSACGGEDAAAGSRSPTAATSVTPAAMTTTTTVATASETSSAAVAAFVHPGLLHTEADFARMREKVAAQAEPWLSGWNVLAANGFTSLTRTPNPQTTIYRGSDGVHAENYGILYRDVAATYGCALRWKVSGDTAYADKAVQYLNAWGATLAGIGGDTNAALAAGIYGYEFANAAEIMRGYAGWGGADLAQFQAMMRKVFYPINHDFLARHNNTEATHYWANWDLCNLASILAIGVLCDDRALFDEAIGYFRNGAGNGAISQAVYYVHPGYLGQWQESGRDQGHNTLGIALGGAICEMAWNQGVDLYGEDNNRFLAGAEYVAKANLIESGTSYYSVPFAPYNNVDNVNQTALSTSGQGTIRPCWALVYNHYVNRKGLAAPFTQRFARQIEPEGGGGNYGPNSGGFDQLGYGTLTCSLDPIASGAAPSGLFAAVEGGRVVLSWWGSAYAASYNVKRATIAGGPYATIATVAAGTAGSTTYTDSSVAAGTYYYAISAVTPSGETANSAQTKAVTAVVRHLYLPFDESAGTTAADATGNGFNGTLVNGGTWVAGRQGNALAFDGVDDYLSLPSGLVSGLSDFSIAAWVWWDAARNWERVFDFGTGTGHYMFLSPRAGSGKVRFAITTNGSSGEEILEGTGALPTGQWVHVAVTLSGKTGSLYVNGALANTNTAMWFAPFRLGNTTQNWLGRSQFSADPTFRGKIDDFQIHRGALSAAQVAALAAG